MASSGNVQAGDYVEVEMREWLVEEKGLDGPRVEGIAKVVTRNGGLLLETVDRGEMWLPLSQCNVTVRAEERDDDPVEEGDLPF